MSDTRTEINWLSFIQINLNEEFRFISFQWTGACRSSTDSTGWRDVVTGKPRTRFQK